MTKDVVIDNRVKHMTLYLVPKGRGYEWSRFDNKGNYVGTAKVVLESAVICGCIKIKEILRVMNPMKIQADLKPGMNLTN